jgi:hypothetical protein
LFSEIPVLAHRKSNVLLSVLVLTFFVATTQAQVALNQISSDPFTNNDSQHATQVEPDTFAFGSTIVATFQQGRFDQGGGSSDNGWATSLDGGVTWQHGSLPGLTKIEGTGPYDRVSDPAVAFDAAHGVWMIASLPILTSGAAHTAMAVSRSVDGGLTWQKPVNVTPDVENSDKTWIACDNNATSPFFGHCYAEWDDNFAGDVIFLSTSTDGGLSWGPAKQPAGGPIGLGGMPLAKPNGTVVVPGADAFLSSFIAYGSRDGGNSWSSAATIANPITHAIAGGLRDLNLPSAAMDAAGRTFVVWHDCRFRTNCSSNDIVVSVSSNGRTWSPPRRIPIDPVGSTVDHFLPAIDIEPGTSGTTAHIGVTYYFYPRANCTISTCRLMEGFISSSDGGKTWTAPTTLAGPMSLTWLPNTSQGLMVGDYQSLSFVNGAFQPVFAVASSKVGNTFNEAMFTPVTGLEEGPALYSGEGDRPVPNAQSDHPPRLTSVRVH